MSEGTCIRLEVALRCSADTISGIVDDHQGQAVQFSGWLELMSAFDTVCARAGDLQPGGPDSGARDRG